MVKSYANAFWCLLLALSRACSRGWSQRRKVLGRPGPAKAQLGVERPTGASTWLSTAKKADTTIISKWSTPWQEDPLGACFNRRQPLTQGRVRGPWSLRYEPLLFPCDSAVSTDRHLALCWGIFHHPLWRKWNVFGRTERTDFWLLENTSLFHSGFISISQGKRGMAVRPVSWHLWGVFWRSIWVTKAKNCYKGNS